MCLKIKQYIPSIASIGYIPIYIISQCIHLYIAWSAVASMHAYTYMYCTIYIKVHAYCIILKDHIEKIDFQEIFIAVVNWPNSELYRAIVCTTR